MATGHANHRLIQNRLGKVLRSLNASLVIRTNVINQARSISQSSWLEKVFLRCVYRKMRTAIPTTTQ